jgi:protein-tyrosine-phosphatase
LNILFVCTGNTCRSAMAEGMLKAMLKEKGMDHIQVSSAGIAASSGEAASRSSISVMDEIGIDLKNHRARQVSTKQVKEADLILTMTEGHKNMIQSWEPSVWKKIFTLMEYADAAGKDISDPFGLPEEEYRRTREELRQALEKIIEKLENR